MSNSSSSSSAPSSAAVSSLLSSFRSLLTSSGSLKPTPNPHSAPSAHTAAPTPTPIPIPIHTHAATITTHASGQPAPLAAASSSPSPSPSARMDSKPTESSTELRPGGGSSSGSNANSGVSVAAQRQLFQKALTVLIQFIESHHEALNQPLPLDDCVSAASDSCHSSTVSSNSFSVSAKALLLSQLSRPLMEQACTNVSHSLVRFIVFLSKSADGVMALQLAEELERHLQILVYFLRSIMTRGGASLRSTVSIMSSNFLKNLKSAVEELMNSILSSGTSNAETTRMSGVVLEACEDIQKKLPLTNASAVFKIIATQFALLKDVKTELQKMKEDAAQEKEEKQHHAAEDEHLNDDDDDGGDFFDDDEPLNEQQMLMLNSALIGNDAALTITRKLSTFLVKHKFDEDADTEVQWLESVAALSRSIAHSFDDLSNSLSDDDADEWQKEMDKLLSSCHSLLLKSVQHKQFADKFASVLLEKDEEQAWTQVLNESEEKKEQITEIESFSMASGVLSVWIRFVINRLHVSQQRRLQIK